MFRFLKQFFVTKASRPNPSTNHRRPSVLRVNLRIEFLESRTVLAVEGNIVGDWPTYGNGPSHTNYISGNLGTKLTSEIRWSFSSNSGCFSPRPGQAVVGIGLVFVSGTNCSNTYVAALDEDTGNEVWRHDFGFLNSLGNPSFDQGHIYVRSSSGLDSQLWSFNAATGLAEWTTVIARWESYPLTISGGRIYIADAGALIGIDQSTGKQLFAYKMDPWIRYEDWSPSTLDGHLYTFVGGVFREHSTSSGEPLWSLELSPPWKNYWYVNTLPAMDSQRAYLISGQFTDQPVLVGVDLFTHKQLWRVAGQFSQIPTVAKGTVYAVQNKTVQAFDAETGVLRATYNAQEPLNSQPLVTDDAILVSTGEHTFVFDRNSRAVRLKLRGQGGASIANNKLYLPYGSTLTTYELNPTTFLSIQIPTQVNEEQGTLLGKGTVTVSSVPSKDLVVFLDSNNPSRLRVSQTVTIRAWTKTANFNLEVVNNAIADFDARIVINGSAAGLQTTSNTIKVIDDDPTEVGLAGDWTSYGNGPSRTGYFPGKIGTHIAPKLIWENPISDFHLQPVVTGDGMVFVAGRLDNESYLSALDAETGKEIWRHLFGVNTVIGAPTFDRGRIYLREFNGLYSFFAISGVVEWTTPLMPWNFAALAPTVSNGVVYIGEHSNTRGFNQATGELLFSFGSSAIGGVITPTFYDNHLYTGTKNIFREHASTTGIVVRSLDLGESLRPTSINSLQVIDDQRAFFILGDYSPGLVGIDLVDFKQLWRVDDWFSVGPTVANGIVYVGIQGLIKAYDSMTGAQIAIYNPYEPMITNPIITDDAIIVSSSNKTYVLDLATGAKLSTFPVGGTLSLANDTLYIASQNGVLSAFALHPRLSLELPKRVSEKAGILFFQGVVKLDKAPSKDVLVQLKSDGADRLKAPEFVRIRAGTTSAIFDVEILDNSNLDIDAEILVTASLLGSFRATATVFILDDEPAVLTVRMPAMINEANGTLRLAGVVSSEIAPSIDTVVELLSSNTNCLKVPLSVTLKAHTTSVNFDVTSIDNLVEDGPQTVEVRAIARNWTTGVATTTILDNEIPSLAIVAPSVLIEDSGIVSGSIHIPYAIDSDLLIEIRSTLAGQLDVPNTIIIRSGLMSATFEMRIGDDSIVNGQRNGMIQAKATQYRSAFHEVLVQDDERPALRLGLPTGIIEGNDLLTQSGTVFLNFRSERDVEIALRSSDPERVSIPLKVTIPAGQQSITFDLHLFDNRRVDKTPNITVSATATGWSSGIAVMPIQDDDVLGLIGEWQSLGNGTEHSGYFPGFFGKSPKFLKAWNGPLGFMNPVATGEGLIFATPHSTVNGTFLAAIETTTGSEIWRYIFEDAESISAPTYNDGHVYVQRDVFGDNSQLWSINASTGLVDWIAPYANDRQRYLAPTVGSGSVFIGGGFNGGLLGFDQVTGERQFFAELDPFERWAPTFNDGKLYSWVGDILREHSTTSGQATKYLNLEWENNLWSVNTVPAMLAQNAYAIGGQGLHGIDLASFTQRWVVPGAFEGIPAVDRDSVFAIKQGVLEAFDVSTGESKGVFVTGDPVFGQPIVTDDSIVVGSSKNTYVFDRMTREAIAILPVGGRISIANNQLLMSGENELSVYAINPQSPWQNRPDNKDVNRDGYVSPIDVLLIINHLNIFGSGNLASLPTDSIAPDTFLDVDGDFAAGPLDILVIINWLNARDANGEGEFSTDGTYRPSRSANSPIRNDNGTVSDLLLLDQYTWSICDDFFSDSQSGWRLIQRNRI